MADNVECPHCGFRFSAEAPLHGIQASCPKCGRDGAASRSETAEGLTGLPESGPAVFLTVVDGPMLGQEFHFEEHDTFVFGRSSSCHASLPDDSFVSRHHFILEANPPQACVRDLGSLNGTWINDVRYGGSAARSGSGMRGKSSQEKAILKDGDCIRVGKTVFAVAITNRREHTSSGQGERLVQLPTSAHIEGVSLHEAIGEAAADARPASFAAGNGDTAVSDDAFWPSIEGYSLARGLGRGGMGAVYLVVRQRDDRRFAMKLMLSRAAMDERRCQAFLRETKLLAGLNHPNIVQLIEQGVVGSTFFFVMEYCDGGDVGGLVKASGGPLPATQALSILMDSLKGLAYAHSRGVVHRDIKPSNLLLSGSDGKQQVKLSDFGLAKSFELAGLSGMTATGMTAGSCAFMPREQVTDFRYVRPASDVWSIAATFYFMVTGHPPREGRRGQDPLDVILSEPVIPIGQRLPHIPPQLAKVMEKALRIEPDGRYETAVELQSALEGVQAPPR